jgi:sugar phosphate isomerase/epimerase
MRPTLAQICTLHAPFEVDIADYAAAQCRSIELWLGKLETFLQSHSTQAVRRLLDEHEVQAPVASFQGGLAAGPDDARAQHWEHLGRRLELCRELGIGTLVVAADFVGPVGQYEIDRIARLLGQAADHAAEHGVRLALEFQARAAICNNLQTALAMVAMVDNPHLGLCFDAFHYFTGPSKSEDLEPLTTGNLFHVQLCDVADTPRELATDADRILPGDGGFPLGPIIETLQRIHYTDCVSMELVNPRIWKIAPRSFAEIGMTALHRVLGLTKTAIWIGICTASLLFPSAASATHLAWRACADKPRSVAHVRRDHRSIGGPSCCEQALERFDITRHAQPFLADGPLPQPHGDALAKAARPLPPPDPVDPQR